MSKTVLITGCNRGIGREAVRLFAENGYNLICCIRQPNDEFASFTATLSNEHGVEIETIYFDMTDEAGIKAALTPLVKENRKIDVLVNNAGIASGGLINMTSMAKLKEVFQINFFSQVLITQLVSKLMIRHKSGSIINMCSIGGIETNPGYLSYGSSKASLIWMTKSVAKELAPFGVRVNGVAPGLVDTDMGNYKNEIEIQKTLNRTAMHRFGHKHEIAEVILFLASDKSSFMTGQILIADGGRM
ncbi:MAG: SDR family oxidoreductase [Barnesiella sp.]|nr:SDR family oxidoreductase [Barnesiella sp.]